MYSESERPWFAWFFVGSGLVAGACYARWGRAVAEKGWVHVQLSGPGCVVGLAGQCGGHDCGSPGLSEPWCES